MSKFVLKCHELEYKVEESEVIRIGRSPENSIILDDIRVSAHHCEICWEPDHGATIKDLGSANGTIIFRNDEKILVGRRPDGVNRDGAKLFVSEEVPLFPGDRIRLYSEGIIEVDYSINLTQKEMKSGFDNFKSENNCKAKETCKSKKVHKVKENGKVEETHEAEENINFQQAASTKEFDTKAAKKMSRLEATEKEKSFDDIEVEWGSSLISQLKKRYRMERLYVNRFTELWKATPLNWNEKAETIVVKILTMDESVGSVEAELLFEREKNIATQLSHPNIIKTYKSGRAGNQHYIMMEYCKYNNLADFVKDYKLTKMTEKMAVKIIVQMLRALNYYHYLPLSIQYNDKYQKATQNCVKLVHRDIKPENVLVRSVDENNYPEIVISDFGLAKDTLIGGQSGITTNKNTIRATLSFAPCDQIQNSIEVNTGVDIWSTFAVLFWLLTGETPRDMTNCNLDCIENYRQLANVKEYFKQNHVRKIRSLRNDITEDLADLIDSVLSTDQNIYEYSSEEELELINKLESML